MSGQPTALIVNDDPSQLRLIGAVLERVGIATRACAGVEAALARLGDDPAVDLIVTDLHMPDIDGWQFCQLLRSPEYARFNRVPILVVSATFSGSDAEQLSFDLGADAFLAAPFAPSALQEYARTLLDGRRPDAAPHLLLIEPDAGEAERLRAAFAAQGYVVDVVHSGGEALRAWATRHADVAVIDAAVGDVPAERLLAEIKQPGSRAVAFAITHDADRGHGLALARCGADASLRFPVDPQRLVALCDAVRRQRSLMRVEELLEERGRALRESEARWRSLFEAIPEIVIVHDDTGVILHVNQLGAEQLEWQAHELTGRHLDELHGAPASPGTDVEQYETVLRTRGGRGIDVEINRRRMQFEGCAAVLSVARDIGARKELARQQQQFLAMLTHDIKNPLAVVLGFIELLGEVGALNDEQRDLVGRIGANADTVLALVANYLNLSQIESGRLRLHRMPQPAHELLEEVAVQYRGHAERQGIAFAAEIPADLGTLEVDRLAIERALANLVHNAIKFTPEGGQVTLRARRDGGELAIDVADTGVGIAPADAAALFQPFRRGMDRQPREGVGLGLFIAHSLIAAHAGRIGVESAPGRGTTFTVRLPAAAPRPARAAAQPS